MGTHLGAARADDFCSEEREMSSAVELLVSAVAGSNLICRKAVLFWWRFIYTLMTTMRGNTRLGSKSSEGFTLWFIFIIHGSVKGFNSIFSFIHILPMWIWNEGNPLMFSDVSMTCVRTVCLALRLCKCHAFHMKAYWEVFWTITDISKL